MRCFLLPDCRVQAGDTINYDIKDLDMKNILQEIAEKIRKQETAELNASEADGSTGTAHGGRRNFLKKAALGGIALGGMMKLSVEDTIAQSASGVQRSSSPSELKITDMRVAVNG